ncbi:MAG: hypothetical protein CMH57_10270 [Myxococcales bacterium]|nr:hypothetical protein [Myxococcales bacterium]
MFMLALLVLVGVGSGCSDDGGEDGAVGSGGSSNTTGGDTSNATTGGGTTAGTTGGSTGTTGGTTAGTTGATPCEEDSGCGVGEICVEELCQLGCREDQDCAQNELCLEQQCVAQGVGCRDDGDCGGGFYCDLRQQRCAEDDGGCRDDLDEPNDNTAEATVVDGEAQFTGRYLCDGDNDYYRVMAEVGEVIVVEMRFTHADGDLAFEILESGGRPLLREDTDTDDEETVYVVQSPGAYYVRVFSTDDEEGFNTYNLSVVVSEDVETCEDDLEPNQDAQQAAGIRTGSYDLSLCPEDTDWFALNLAPGAMVELSLTSASTRMALTFYDRDGSTVLAHSENNMSEQALDVSVDLAGLYFVQVESEEIHEAGINYTLTAIVDGLAVDPACNDRFEPNEAPEGAIPLQIGRYDELTICSSDNDYYSVELGVQDQLTVTALFEHMFANIDLELYDAAGELLERSISSTNNEEIFFEAPIGGTYTLRVRHSFGVTNEYALLLFIEPGPEAPDCDDAYGDLRTRDDALPLPEEGVTDARVCQGRPDHFTLTTDVGNTLLDLAFLVDVAFGALEVDVRAPGPTGELLATLEPAEEPARLLLEEPGEYALQVRAVAGEATPYSLRATLTPPPSCDEDPAEPNDTFMNAATLTDTLGDLIMCSEEEDWFAVEVAATTALTITADDTDAFGAVALTLFEPDGVTIRAESDGPTVDDLIIDAGTYYVRATLREGLNTPYAITVTAEDRSDCFDAFEPNNAYTSASPIEPGTLDGLHLCDVINELDFYAIELGAQDTITINATFSHEVADIDLRLLDTSGVRTLRSSSSSDDDETLTTTVQTTGTYFIRLNHHSGDPGTYALEVIVDAFEPPACNEDDSEEDDTADTARVVEEGEQTGSACFDDPDWFAIDVPSGRYLTTELDFTHDDGDLALDIIGADGQSVLFTSDTDTDGEVLSWLNPGPEAQRFYVRVRSVGAAANSYTLQLSFTDEPVVFQCRDAFEPNNSLETATPIEPGIYEALDVCRFSDGDDTTDWYVLNVEAGLTVTVQLTFTDDVGDIDLYAYGPDGTATFLADSRTRTDDESLTFVTSSPEPHYIQVRHFSGNPSPYTMEITTEAYTPPACEEDGQEEDDSPIEARFIEPGVHEGQICFGDSDWFTFSVADNQRITARLMFANAEGNLNMRLYDETGTNVLARTTSHFSSNETLSRTFTTGGVYLVEVFGVGGAQNDYTFGLEIFDL